MLKSHEQALKTMNNEEGGNLCSESVFSLFLFAGYFQMSLTLFSKKGHHFKKILVPFSKKEATSHEWLQMSEHSKDIESFGGCLLDSAIS